MKARRRWAKLNFKARLGIHNTEGVPFGHTPTLPVNCNKLNSACTLGTARFCDGYPNCLADTWSLVVRGVVVSTSLAPRALPYNYAALASRGGLLLLPEELVSHMYSLLKILCQGYDAGFKE